MAAQPSLADPAHANFRSMLQQLAKDYTTSGNDILQRWNQFSGVAQSNPQFIVLQGAVILQLFQETVKDAGNLRETMVGGPFPCFSGTPPVIIGYLDNDNNLVVAASAPDLSTQKQIIAHIEGLGILARGTLGFFESTVSNGLVFAGNTAQKVVNTTTSPWFWWALGLGAVAVAAIVFAPEIKTALKAKPAPKPVHHRQLHPRRA
jgi:hypothetical protein